MPQATSKISQFPSPIERLFRQYQTAAAEKARCYSLFTTTHMKAGGGLAADAAVDCVEARCNAAYEAVEDVVDAILAIDAGSVADLAIKAHVLAQGRSARGADGVYHRIDDVVSFFADVQAFADAI